MKLHNRISIIFFFSIYSLQSMGAFSSLKKLVTKQNLNKIRFISNDGRFTYYQRSKGSLALYNNYALKEVLKGNNNTFYHVLSSPERKQIIIMMDPHYYDSNSITSDKYIFAAPYGGSQTTLYGKGSFPQLHLNDTWLSFYKFQERTLHFVQLQTELRFKINIQSKANPFFYPKNIMVSERDVIYTDVNEKGEQAIILLNRNTHKNHVLMKSSPGVKLEICLNKNILYVGKFSHPSIKNGSEISFLDLKINRDFSKRNVIYQSKINDTGNIICDADDNNIYFIKTTSTDEFPMGTRSEVFQLNRDTKKLIKKSDLNYVTQMLNLDGKIIIPFREDFFIVEKSMMTPSAPKTSSKTVKKK